MEKDQTFDAIYAGLNEAQRQAVDVIYGPVLVIAGPGTGKTQLLSARVAHILRTTDTQPHNILCLTFTESGAANMRERLTRFIGPHAYDVTIGTYHAFGSTVINRFPEYFTDIRLERPVDNLGKRQILSEIIEGIDYRSPIKQTRHHLGDLISTISEIKRGLLSPDDLRAIADENIRIIAVTQSGVSETLQDYTKMMPRKASVALPLFETVHDIISQAARGSETTGDIPSYALLAASTLETALAESAEADSTKPLTAWKNKWLVKNKNNEYILAGGLEAARLRALAGVLEAYSAKLAEQGLYDFDDMILKAIDVLRANDDLRYTLQEQYQFILLDEFQDTNRAQLELVQLLTDNPVHEGRPNVLAVGDDDQAIYAFQGAEASNMLDYARMFRDVTVISLRENYRSRAEVLQSAANISAQIESRLHHNFDGVTKELLAKNMHLPEVSLTRESYLSAVDERVGVAGRIERLIEQGTPPQQIAVLAPKHRYLEPLVPYLQDKDIAVSYEKRENILDAPVIRELLTMCRLALAIAENNQAVANSLWPEVLSYDFWGFPVAEIWQLSWQASDERSSWSEQVLAHKRFRHAALLILGVSSKAQTEPIETVLDILIGTSDIETRDSILPSVRSPLRDFYFKKQGETVLYETVSQLTVLRSKLREHQAGRMRVLHLKDLLNFVAEYDAAEEQLLNTSPHNQSQDAVQLMTVFKAKGLEFDHVFLVACSNDVWGTSASGNSNKLTLPANLAKIRHTGGTDDERLRLLFVAMTRAKHGLYLTSHQKSYSGKKAEPIKYFDESRIEDELIARILPETLNRVQEIVSETVSIESLQTNWQNRHLRLDTPLKALLQDRLKSYQLSPTHLTTFLNLKYGGPESFLLGTLLRFPSAGTVDSSFGNAMHATLEWLQNELNRTGTVPTEAAAVAFAMKYLEREPLTIEQHAVQSARALGTIQAFYANQLATMRAGNLAEKSFRNENVFLGDVHMGGKIDLLEIDKERKRIVVVDYKTGQIGSDTGKLRRYEMQLYCYKLLVEKSRTFAGYTVEQGKLIFLEPTPGGETKPHERLITFKQNDVTHLESLLGAMWQCVMQLDMPDISGYGDSVGEAKRFESDLIARLENS